MTVPDSLPPTESSGATTPARRKLIRGAFALPAIAAVHSGSALAQSSSLQCLANGPTGARAPLVTYPGPTVEAVSYLRIALAVALKNPAAAAGQGNNGAGVGLGVNVLGLGVGVGLGLGKTKTATTTTATITPEVLYYVSGPDLYALAAKLGVSVAPTLISSTGYRLFDVADSNNRITGAEITKGAVETGYTLQTAVGNLPNAQRPLAALIFSKDGSAIVGVGVLTGSQDSFAATASCWTSFGTVA